ncbi:MAG: lipase family protein [Polaromonas sp.]
MSRFKLSWLALSAAVALTACGGGSDGPANLSGVVADGYLNGATVCLDLNNNVACDAGEPSATTTAGGKYSMAVPAIDMSGLSLLAVAGTNTVDEGLGGSLQSLGIRPYVLATPASAPEVVSPLTTLVSRQMAAASMTAAAAEAAVVAELGLAGGTTLLKNDFVATQNTNLQGVATVLAVSIGTALEANNTALQGTTVTAPGAAARQAIDSAKQVAIFRITGNGLITSAIDAKALAATIAEIQRSATVQAAADVVRLKLLAAGSSLPSAVRGNLVATKAAVTLTAAQITGSATQSGLIAISSAAKCDVSVQQIVYLTAGKKPTEVATASAALLLPSGANCPAGPYPLVAYAKGTDMQKPRTLANPADGETFLLAAMYAAQGYAVVATDYLGFAESTYPYHPYLHADSEASAVVDSIRAARKVSGINLSGKVMLTGYSQGGHASMAAHRAIERDIPNEIDVVAGAHLAGPYNLSGSFKLTSAIAGYQFFVPYLVTAWQKVYGDVYGDVNAVFKAPYAGYIENLLPSPTLNSTTLVTSGKLPGGPAVTPDQARDVLFQSAFVADTQTSSSHPLYLAGKKNDLLGWSPKSRLLLCGGAGDPTVPPAVHQAVMKADFDSRNLANVSSVDVDANVRAAYGAVLASSPATYYGNYHGTYEPPFCHANARGLFDLVK